MSAITLTPSNKARTILATLLAFIVTVALLPMVQIATNTNVTTASAVTIDGGWGGGGSVFGNNSTCSGSACGALASSGGGGGAGDPNRSYVYISCDGASTCSRNYTRSYSISFSVSCTGGTLYHNRSYVATGFSNSLAYVNRFRNSDTGAASIRSQMNRNGQESNAFATGTYTKPDGSTQSSRWSYVGCKWETFTNETEPKGATQTCNADYGREFPFPVAIAVTYYDTDPGYVINPSTGQRFDFINLRVENVSCLYISSGTPPRKILWSSANCYWNVTYSSAGSTNRSAVQWGGTPTNKPPVVRVADTSRQPWTNKVNGEARLNDCTTYIPYSAALNLENEPYAYYRLQANGLTQYWEQYIWDTAWTGGRAISAEWRAGSINGLRDARYSVYTCSLNGGSPVNYPNFGSLPTSVNFKEASCPQVRWSCNIPRSPEINGTGVATTVMRDGTLVPLRLPGVNLSGPSIRDVTTKTAGAVNGNNLSYKLTVNDGSSPFLGTDPNASKQYFNLYNQNGKTRESFNTWSKDPNANINKYMSYYWSTDNGKTWSLTYSARVDQAEFYVPVVNTSDGGVYYAWRQDENLDCGSRASNQVTVIRSVNSQG